MRLFIVMLVVSVITMSCNCSNLNYAKAVKKDTERIFKEKKDLIYSLAFVGTIIRKDKCETCNINKFVIHVNIKEMNQEIQFQDEKYMPYYSFEDNRLSLSINQNVYENLKENEIITKSQGSRFIEYKKRKFKILHKDELYWLP